MDKYAYDSSHATPQRRSLLAPLFACIACYGLAGGPRIAGAQISLPSSGDIGVVAGQTGSSGYSGNGGAATSATLYFPHGVAVDGNGNLYIADTTNQVIRKVMASTGDISTVAGSGTSGYSGDGGAATSAELSNPYGVAVDAGGNVYIADTGNYVIREVSASTGYISTIAGNGTSGYSGNGGPAASAQLSSPVRIAVDASGDVYVVDSANDVVREVSGGYIYLAAGGGPVCNSHTDWMGDGCSATSAVLGNPTGVAIDSSGNLYIADAGAEEIRVVSASTGVISGVAGTFDSYGFSGDGGPATSALLSSPFAVSVDSSGNLYIADNGNERIREVAASTGYISTIAGDGTYGDTGDGGSAASAEIADPEYIAVDGNGNVYLASTSYYVVRAIAP